MKRILLITAFLLGFGVYVFSQISIIATVTWGNTSLTYNGNTQAPTATAVNMLGQNVAITVTGQQTNVGKGYTATATTTTGYQLLNATTSFTIAAATIPVQWGNTYLEYNGSQQAPTASVTGFGRDRLGLRISGGQTNAGGQYTASATLNPSNSNYILSNTSTSFTISPYYLYIQWSSTTLRYTGYPQTPTPSATGVFNENVPLNVSGEQTNVGGPYLATVSLSSPNPNYEISSTQAGFSGATNFYITKATLQVQWGNTSLIYSGISQTPTATLTGVMGENLPLSVSGGQIYVGTGYLASASLITPNNNYEFANSAFANFSIGPATVPVQWGNTTLTHTGSPQAPTATATGVLNENLPLDVSGQQTNVGGPYTATATLSPTNNNYTLSNTTTTFTIIQPANNTYSVQWSNLSLSYNGNPQTPTAIATNTSGVSIAVTVSGEQTNVGTGYTATATLATPNPAITLTNTTTQFAITPATVPVVWSNTTLTYNGSPQTPTATATGVKNENLSLNVSGEQTNVGAGYTATASLYPVNNNYTLSNTTTTFAIVQPNTNPDTYIVQWGNTSLTYTGYPQAPAATATNSLGQSVAIAVTGDRTDVGTGYTATAAPGTPNSNITLTNATTRFDITRANIPVQWGNTILIYNGRPQLPTASAIGVKGEDLPLNVTGAQTNIGKGYIATAALRSSNNNYLLTNTTTLFDIIQQSINNYTVEWGDKSFSYNGQPQAPTATATNTLGQSLAITVTGAQIDIGADYTATASPAVPNNAIMLINASTEFEITAAPLDVAAVSETIEIGQTPVLAYTVQSGQLFGNDAFTGSLSVETTLPPPYPIGEYVIGQGTLTVNDNYRMSFTKGTLTVINTLVDQFEILVNDKSTKQRGELYYGDPAENGEDHALVFVLANPGETITINTDPQNPRTVALPVYGDNRFTITVKPPYGTPKDHTLIIERYYEKVYFEYPDVPTISCNTQTNGGLTFSDFQWYRVGEVDPVASGQYIQVKDNATYYCELTPMSYSNTKLRTINVRAQDLRSSGNLTAYPNPTQGKVTILQNANEGAVQKESSGKAKIQVFDLNGSLMLQPETNPFDMRALPQGMYFIRMNGQSVKVIKTN